MAGVRETMVTGAEKASGRSSGLVPSGGDNLGVESKLGEGLRPHCGKCRNKEYEPVCEVFLRVININSIVPNRIMSRPLMNHF